MNVKQLPRVFHAKVDSGKITLADPNPTFTPKEVIEHYSSLYPELTNAKVREPKIENDEILYELDTDKGTHG